MSPAEDRAREVLVDERLVVGAELDGVRPVLGVVALRVEIALLERTHPREHGLVLLINEVRVAVVGVPGVEGVEANHILRSVRKRDQKEQHVQEPPAAECTYCRCIPGTCTHRAPSCKSDAK